MKAYILVKFKEGVENLKNPEERELTDKLSGYPAVIGGRKEKYFEITLSNGYTSVPKPFSTIVSRYKARKHIRSICKTLLANPVYEEYKFKLEGDKKWRK